MANVIAQSGRSAIIMAHNKTLAAQLYAEMREFFPENAVEYFVSYYDYYQPEAYVPSRDLFIEKDSAINEHIEQMRLSATKNLMTRDDVIIVATVSAIYGIGDPTEYQQMVLSVKEGDTIEQRDIIATLVSMQYERGDLDFKRGSFRVRGDVIDVYPAESSENALRISCLTTKSTASICSTRFQAALFNASAATQSSRPATTLPHATPYCAPASPSKKNCANASNFSPANNAPSNNNASNSAPALTLKCSTKWASAKASKLLPPLLRQKRR